MSRKIGLLVALGFSSLLAYGQQSLHPELHGHREQASDLEIAGLVKGVPPGESRFVSREFLEGLPQAALMLRAGGDFGSKSQTALPVKGFYLDVLAKALGAEDAAVAAICSDGYTSSFSKEYIQKHRPVFVMSIEGMTPHEWSLKNQAYDAGPYFIGYEDFVPSFHVLSHVDQPAEPDGITKIVFDTDKGLFAGIVPKAGAGTEVLDGARIARQNCYRCHNSGEQGGTKAAFSWSQVGSIARRRPEYFMSWVHNPQAINAKSSMPPNPEYDKATLIALERYFATFAGEGE